MKFIGGCNPCNNSIIVPVLTYFMKESVTYDYKNKYIRNIQVILELGLGNKSRALI